MPYVTSTVSNDIIFTKYSRQNRIPKAERKILIKGGANVANSKTLITEVGVVTQVTDEEMHELLSNERFKRMVARGFLKVTKGKVSEVEKVVQDMTPRDESAPKTPDQFDSASSTSSTEEDEEKKPKPHKAKAEKKPAKVKTTKKK